eukprot:8984816-Pyramimonas_sp.AAC.1
MHASTFHAITHASTRASLQARLHAKKYASKHAAMRARLQSSTHDCKPARKESMDLPNEQAGNTSPSLSRAHMLARTL